MYATKFLTHYGVLGMHWGVRKAEPVGTGRQSTSKEKEYDKKFSKIREQLKNSGLNEKALQDKYGEPNSNGFLAFVKKHKTGLEIGAGAVVGVAALAALYYYGKPLAKNVAGDVENGIYGQTLANLLKTPGLEVDGLLANWDKGVDLSAGSIIKRVSTQVEGTARPEGFYASFLDGDVKSYKAMLPGFWKTWGIGSPAKGGFVNSYKALVGVKAPSGSESVSIFKDLCQSDEHYRSLTFPVHPEGIKLFTDEDWKNVFRVSSTTWTATDYEPTKIFLNAVKARGYNAIIDFNDAGKLAKTPIRVLDGSKFEVVRSDLLEFPEILKSVESWTPELVHILVDTNELTHWGVLGMHWGVRKQQVYSGTSRPVGKKVEASPQTVTKFISKHKRGLAAISGIVFTASAAVIGYELYKRHIAGVASKVSALKFKGEMQGVQLLAASLKRVADTPSVPSAAVNVDAALEAERRSLLSAVGKSSKQGMKVALGRY